jgi:hypothetical protein
VDATTTADGVVASGVFPGAALLNHSCSPNCFKRFTAEGNLELVAARDIATGEELCHSYINELAFRSERQRQLLEGYGFTCKCARCEGLSLWPAIDIGVVDFTGPAFAHHNLSRADQLHKNAILVKDPTAELAMLEEALDIYLIAGAPAAHKRVQQIRHCAMTTALEAGDIGRATAHAEGLVKSLEAVFCTESARLGTHPTLQRHVEILEQLKCYMKSL